MPQSVLVINCGSSSVKFALIPTANAAARVQGLAESLGKPEARLTITNETGQKTTQAISQADHQSALQAIFSRLGPQSLIGIGHRVVHGGELFTVPVALDASVIAQVQAVTPLAPLHNPANLLGIEAAQAYFPQLPQVAVFDTAFHQTMPPYAYRYAVPDMLYRENGVRKYGFHGISHAYVAHRLTMLNGQNATGQGWLIAHLGNGCSVTAVWEGRSLDTSMGLTPLDGVVMGTRSGSVDPGLHQYLQRTRGWTLDAIDDMLNRQSGLLGLSGQSNDMRTLLAAQAAGDEAAILAIEVFCYRLAQSMAAMSCALPYLSGIAFTGGIGENAAPIRAKTLQWLKHWNLHPRTQENELLVGGKEGRFDASQGPVLWVIPTDEEGWIAQQTQQVLNGKTATYPAQ